MEAIKAIAKRTKTGKYTIDLPIKYNEDDVAATALVNNATLISADNIFSKVHTLKFQLIKA